MLDLIHGPRAWRLVGSGESFGDGRTKRTSNVGHAPVSARRRWSDPDLPGDSPSAVAGSGG